MNELKWNMLVLLFVLSSAIVCNPSCTYTSNLLAVSTDVTLFLVDGSRKVTQVMSFLISEADGAQYSVEYLSSQVSFPNPMKEDHSK